jgi:chromosome segregation ATPase
MPKQKKETSEQKVRRLTKENKVLTEENEGLRGRIIKKENENAARETEIRKLKDENWGLGNKIENLESSERSLEKHNAQLKASLEETEKKFSDFKEWVAEVLVDMVRT